MSGNKLTWDVLTQYRSRPPMHFLGRDAAVQQAYEEHKASLRTPIEIYIIEEIMKGKSIHLSYNEFPYLCDGGIHHLLLWMLPGFELDVEPAIEYILKQAPVVIKKTNVGLTESDIVIFKNDTSNQSIKGLPHYQVFIKSS